MAELERFIEWWYGPRQPEYGSPLDELHDLPDPLRRLYAFAGRWPSPDPSDGTEFYCASGGHYLLPPSRMTGRLDRKLCFFREYQGDWDGLTEHAGDDPPVWFEGYWDDDDSDDEDEPKIKSRKASDSLSRFLVTHILNVSIEHGERSTRSSRRSQSVADSGPVIWSHSYDEYPGYEGEFLVAQNGMVRRSRSGDAVAVRPHHPQ